MLMRFDPFREVDRLADQVWGAARSTPVMAMDAYRQGDQYMVHFDLPGVDPDSIDLTVEQNVLAVNAERSWRYGNGDGVEMIASERPQGRISRQLFLGEGLDPDQISANYEHGVLTVKIPVAERAKPRKVEIGGGGGSQAISASSSDD